MTECGDIRTRRNRVLVLHAHLVFVTKLRHPVFNDAHLERMAHIMRDVYAEFETEMIESNGDADHVHPLMHHPPEIAISRPVNSLKGVSSRRTRQEFPELGRHYHRANKPRSGSYSAGSAGGAPISVPHEYIEQRNRPGQSTLGPGGPPARAFTPGLKAGALARNSVAAVTDQCRQRSDSLGAHIAPLREEVIAHQAEICGGVHRNSRHLARPRPKRSIQECRSGPGPSSRPGPLNSVHATRRKCLLAGAAPLARPCDEAARRRPLQGAGRPDRRPAAHRCPGVTTVFRHFPTKQALLEATLVRHFEQLTEQARDLVGGPDPAGA